MRPAGRGPAAPRTATAPSAAVAPVPEPVVLIVVAGRPMRPAFALAVVEAAAIMVAGPLEVRAVTIAAGPLEVIAVAIVAEPEMPRVVMRRLMPPRPARMVLEPGRPRLRSKIAARRMPMIHELRAIVQNHAEIERGHRIRVPRGVPVGRCCRWQNGAGAERGSENKMPIHGSSPVVFSSMMEPATRRLNGA